MRNLERVGIFVDYHQSSEHWEEDFEHMKNTGTPDSMPIFPVNSNNAFTWADIAKFPHPKPEVKL